MRRRTPALLCLLLMGVLEACAAHPRATVAGLNSDTRRYRSRECRAARAAALEYEDHTLVRAGVAVAGNLIVPLAGTAVSAAMVAERNRTRERLNRRVAAACVPDPLAERRRTRRSAGRR